MSLKSNMLCCTILATLSFTTIAPAFAQTAPAPTAPEAAKEAEVVVVVGTRIEGAKAAGDLPVSVLTAERIAAVGSVSGDDLFRSIPQAGDVQFQESRTTGNLNDARGDNSSINLRSVGTGKIGRAHV